MFAEIDGDDVRAFFGKSNRMRATLAPWRPVMNATLPSNCMVSPQRSDGSR
ncbi:short-chain dehydrogenase/reductase SDR domain protein [Mycobacterium kansasii 732]|nr:short-chain dehydrogenase/reductase SDR domain protein [Mycobacterium kansasii 732]